MGLSCRCAIRFFQCRGQLNAKKWLFLKKNMVTITPLTFYTTCKSNLEILLVVLSRCAIRLHILLLFHLGDFWTVNKMTFFLLKNKNFTFTLFIIVKGCIKIKIWLWSKIFYKLVNRNDSLKNNICTLHYWQMIYWDLLRRFLFSLVINNLYSS